MTKTKRLITPTTFGRMFVRKVIEREMIEHVVPGYYDKETVERFLDRFFEGNAIPLSTDPVRPHDVGPGDTQNIQPDEPTSEAEKTLEAHPVGSFVIRDLEAELDALERDPDPPTPAPSGPEVTVSGWTEEGGFSAEDVCKGIRNKTLPEAFKRDGVRYFVRRPNMSDVQRWQNSVSRYRA
jgi:hypothetical protein